MENALTRDELRRVLVASGVDPARAGSFEPLPGGTYNSVFRVAMADGTRLVLKVAPDPAAPAMAYETGLIGTEALFYRAAADAMPVPEVVHADPAGSVLGRGSLLMTERPGTAWSAAAVPEADRVRLRAELGAAAARLHRVTGPGFGYPQWGLVPTWRAAYLAMVDAVLADARRFGVELPAPGIGELLRSRAGDLDAVTTPALVHFDLWPGNVLISGDRVTGVVDGERAFWGDPLAEMVSPALFADIEADAAFLAGYRSAGGEIAFDAPARRRLAMYRCHLYLIMFIEAAPRGYLGPDHEGQRALVREHLLAALAELRSS